MLAVRYKQYVAISTLLASGCDVNVQDKEGRTALHYASHTAVAVDSLISAGADVNILDNHGCSPLLMAATEGLDKVVHALCNVPGCDVNLSNLSAKKTPLHILSYKGHTRAVRDLLACRADVNLLDADHRSPLWYSITNGKCDVTAALLSSPRLQTFCQIAEEKVEELCPLEQAAVKGRVDILKLAIWSGYDNVHLRNILSRNDVRAIFEKHQITHWLETGLQVPTLRHLCRQRLRYHMRTEFSERVERLPIPDKLVNYLSFKELEDLKVS
ncbi:ankyrin repeat domain-containing protein 50 [Aplysia californica]|uniref:Ankyrin repeat domain-containing protein 50 n=1 Tax=Aplysia californica TaxID=6500 RepID=A0ABM0JAP3_APLCA|nr:ankyrin repeat domain-containing protein 50 [Aplysia californica]